MWLAGFDPGGERQFGWCVVEASTELPLSLHSTGVASNAAEAVNCVLKEIPSQNTLIAAGIDSPLFWSPDGDRNADRVIRNEIKNLGASAPSGTVQHVNSLRGACLVQGALTAKLIRAAIPSINITEAHPKALLWLIGVATKRQPVKSVTMRELSEVIAFSRSDLSEHERDAALAALGAWAMTVKASGWEDLFALESKPFVPVPPVAYWMPSMPPNPALNRTARKRRLRVPSSLRSSAAG